jgi:hypothetical protein
MNYGLRFKTASVLWFTTVTVSAQCAEAGFDGNFMTEPGPICLYRHHGAVEFGDISVTTLVH